jgi:deoxyribose-phosphate aldolase
MNSMDSIANLISLSNQYDQSLPDEPVGNNPPDAGAIAGWIECALLKPDATLMQVKALCDEARQMNFASVCVNPGYVSLAAGLLASTSISVCSVIAYPLGATLPTLKVIEALTCLSNGASEIDMVLNIGALKGEAYGQVLNEIYAVVQVVHNQRARVTITLETDLLDRREKILACLLSRAAGADYIKNCTEFGQAEVSVHDIDLMARVAGPAVQVKASGSIHNLQLAQDLIAAGAARIVSSSGILIVQEALR